MLGAGDAGGGHEEGPVFLVEPAGGLDLLHLGPAGDFNRQVFLDLGDFLGAGGHQIDPYVPGRKPGFVPGINLPVTVGAVENPDHSISIVSGADALDLTL